MISEELPASLKPLFWDVDFASLSLEKSRGFILKRIIDRGDTLAYDWMKDRYHVDEIKILVLSSRDLSRKTANFWSKYFGLDPNTVPCLLKPYTRIPYWVSDN